LQAEIDPISKALDEFEAVFASEAQGLEVFSVPQKCAYSTTTLIGEGENVLPPSIRGLVTDYAKEEIHEARKKSRVYIADRCGFSPDAIPRIRIT